MNRGDETQPGGRVSPACTNSGGNRFLRFRRLDRDLARLHFLCHRYADIEHPIMELAFDLIHIKTLWKRNGSIELPVRNLWISAGSPAFRRLALAFENELIAMHRNL